MFYLSETPSIQEKRQKSLLKSTWLGALSALISFKNTVAKNDTWCHKGQLAYRLFKSFYLCFNFTILKVKSTEMNGNAIKQLQVLQA